MALLPTKQRDQILLIVIVLALGTIGGYFMYLYEDKSTAIATLETHVATLDSLNESVKADVKRGTFDKARREAAQFEKDLHVLSQLVPSSNEVPRCSTRSRRQRGAPASSSRTWPPEGRSPARTSTPTSTGSA
jgi:Tfp pilus assembly protein PilO